MVAQLIICLQLHLKLQGETFTWTSFLLQINHFRICRKSVKWKMPVQHSSIKPVCQQFILESCISGNILRSTLENDTWIPRRDLLTILKATCNIHCMPSFVQRAMFFSLRDNILSFSILTILIIYGKISLHLTVRIFLLVCYILRFCSIWWKIFFCIVRTKSGTLKNSPTSAGSNRSSFQDEPGLNKVTGDISPNSGLLLLCELVKVERRSFHNFKLKTLAEKAFSLPGKKSLPIPWKKHFFFPWYRHTFSRPR